jgi:hypothetical protein
MGDYNVQQIAFYKLAHQAVRSGDVFWSWTTDLGANFIGSYSFYLLFSPFFWLTLPFPTSWVPYLMGPLLILKTACASLTGYLYIKRFVKNTDWAVVGAICYSFSGFMIFNVFFNHFHEACVFFPLLLVSLEELVQHNRRGFFAAMVALNAMVNYWFFIGEVVFVILYVIVRIITGGWGCTVKKFFLIALESVTGVLLACVTLIPSVLAIVGNPRTGTSELLTGQLMWIWGWNQRLPAIIQSFFFPPELPSAPTFFPEMGAKWSSLSAWLPLFSCVGVIAFCRAKEKNFHKRMIILSMILSLVPIFNSIFVLFNDSYYARWFYMPILMMCVATASALEERETPLMHRGWKSGLRWCGGFVAVFILAIGFTPVRDGDTITFGLYGDKARFWFLSLTAVLCLLLTGLLVLGLSKKRFFYRVTCVFLSVVAVGYSLGLIGSGKHSREYDLNYLETAVEGGDKVTVEVDEPFARSDFYECSDNLGMHWGLPNIQCFHSVVPASVMTFYPSLGIKRDVSSKPSTSYRTLRDLLSVRWLFIPEDEDDQEPMDNFSFYDFQNGYYIYENDYYLPMGFCYDTAVTADTLEDLSGELKSRYLMHALILSEDAIERNADILTVEDSIDYDVFDVDTSDDVYESDWEKRSATAAQSFSRDNTGFTVETSGSSDRMMFFSVPYDDGWSCEINGEPVRIECADYGLMAVRVPAGEATVRFTYRTPGLLEGFALTMVGLILLCIQLIISALFGCRKKPDAPLPQVSDGSAVPLEAYLETLDELPPVGGREEPPPAAGKEELP